MIRAEALCRVCGDRASGLFSIFYKFLWGQKNTLRFYILWKLVQQLHYKNPRDSNDHNVFFHLKKITKRLFSLSKSFTEIQDDTMACKVAMDAVAFLKGMKRILNH